MEEGRRGQGISTHQRQDVEAELGDYLLRHWPKTRWTAGEVEEPGEALCGALRTFVNESSSMVNTVDRGFTYEGGGAAATSNGHLIARLSVVLMRSFSCQTVSKTLHLDRLG